MKGRDTEPQDRFTTEARPLEEQPKLQDKRVNKQPTHDAEKKRMASGQQDPSRPEESVVEEMPHQCTLRPRDPRSKWRPPMSPSTVVGLLEQSEQRLQGGNNAVAPPLPEPASWV